MSMNLALPPFDDVHVRKALNFVMDRDALRRTRGGPLFGETTTHFIPDSLLVGASIDGTPIADYDPYPSEGDAGDVEAAKAEMAQSRYDSDGDGICDDPVCEDILMIADQEAPYPDQNAVIQSSAEQIGLSFDVRSGDRYTFMYDTCDDPGAQWGLCPSVGWFKDYSDAYTFGYPLLHSDAIGSSNYPLLGASPDFLRENGYETTEVPSLDAEIDACIAEPAGDSRIQCWAEVDAQMMEETAAHLPWIFDNDIDIAGPRIVGYVNDAMSGLMSLEQIALADAGAA
jgi:peptide/nickel transport system substrate-binding protein